MKELKKRQSSLHSFLGLPDYRVPKHFYLDWENKKAVFTNENPSLKLWTSDFKWKAENQEIQLSCSLSSGSQPELPPEMYYNSSCIPILKSHLQKCTRRQKAELAVRTSLHLMKLDFVVFLRRWSIIMIEDAILHIHYPVLVWLMCAVSKGFNPPRQCICWLLGLVQATCLHPLKIQAFTKSKPIRLNSKNVIQTKNLEYRDLIYSLQLRKAFGGMKGDAIMLDQISTCLYQLKPNFKTEFQNQASFRIELIDLASIESLKLNDWDLAAIDFHVSDIIQKWAQHVAFSVEFLEECMWEASGGLNYRKLLVMNENESIIQEPLMPRFQSLKFWKQNQQLVHGIAKAILFHKINHGARAYSPND